jgi:YgiT-type zinc finger domain-containing protein
MTCFFCKGTKEQWLTTDVVDLGGHVIVIKNVPCYKCAECGELTYDLAVGERIEEIVDTVKDTVSGEIAVVRYSSDEINVVQYSETAAA